MRKPTAAALTFMALISSVTVAEARGGRTTAQDCEPGSPDPDCPDESPPPAKGQKPPPSQPPK